MIPFPDDPRTDWIDGYDYRVTDYDELVAASTGLPKASAEKQNLLKNELIDKQ